MTDESKQPPADEPENDAPAETNAETPEPPADPPSTVDAVTTAVTDLVADAPDAPDKTSPMLFTTAIINGAGIGLLLGLLLGLAISPVVSGVISVLTGMLALLLGLNEKYLSPLKSVRIGSFGFLCVAGILIGLNIRTNNGMLPSREKMLNEYTKVGFSRQQALDFIAYREFNLVPVAWKGQSAGAQAVAASGDSDTSAEAGGDEGNEAQNGEVAASPASGSGSSGLRFADENQTGAERRNVLYSSEIDASQCYILDMTDSDKPLAQIKNTFEQAGGTWKEMADELQKNLPEKIYVQSLFTLRDCFCEAGQGKILKIPNNAAVDKLSSKQSLAEIKTTLSAAGSTWKKIVDQVSKQIPEANQKTLFLSLLKILGHE